MDKGWVKLHRQIDDSSIMRQPPHYREIFLYLLRKASHKNSKDGKRGQLLRTYRQIQEDLHWFSGYRKVFYKKHHIEKALAWLRENDMVKTRKTTKGIVITITSWDKYQGEDNHKKPSKRAATGVRMEATTEATGVGVGDGGGEEDTAAKQPRKRQRKRQSSDTIYKNVKNEKNIKTMEYYMNNSEVKTKGSTMASIADVIQNYQTKEESNHVKYRWQEQALKYIHAFEIKNDKDKAIMFKLFKKSPEFIESICRYIEESPTKVKNPIGLLLYEVKRRKGLTKGTQKE